jgi:hypothetical protein
MLPNVLESPETPSIDGWWRSGPSRPADATVDRDFIAANELLEMTID